MAVKCDKRLTPDMRAPCSLASNQFYERLRPALPCRRNRKRAGWPWCCRVAH